MTPSLPSLPSVSAAPSSSPSLTLHPLPVDAESDFQRTSPAAAARAQAASTAALRVGGVVLATGAAGFLEACLLVERRPIPLRFAARYAFSSVLPSAVWASAPAEWVAAASGVPASALLLPSTPAAASPLAAPLSAARAKRLLAIKTVRCARQAIGSYALAWSLWRLYAAAEDSEQCRAADAAVAASESAVFEKVVRLAPADSHLSAATRQKHGAHVVTLPLSSDAAADRPHASALAIDWRAQGLVARVPQRHPLCRTCNQEPPARLKLVEVELQGDADSLRSARRVVAKATYDLLDGEELRTVAVLPAHPVAPLSALDAFDVCVNPLAVVLCALATAFELQEAERAVILNADGEEEHGALSADLARSLLYQHGVRVTATTVDEALPAVQAEDADEEEEATQEESTRFVIVTSRRAADGKALAGKLVASGFAASDSVFVVCEESVAAAGGSGILALLRAPASLLRASAPPPDAPQVLSLADTSDALLQRVREALRDGHSSAAVQRAVHRAFGPQRTLQRRRDALSDVGQCIAS